MNTYQPPHFAAPYRNPPHWGPGRLGPHFAERPDPPSFPNASASWFPPAVQGLQGFGSTWTDAFKQIGINATAPAMAALETKVRAEAAAGAKEAVAPLVTKAFVVAGVAAILSVVAIGMAAKKR